MNLQKSSETNKTHENKDELEKPASSKFRVHFCKGSIVIHPSLNTNKHKQPPIPGLIYLLEKVEDHSVILAWTPYHMLQDQNQNEEGMEKVEEEQCTCSNSNNANNSTNNTANNTSNTNANNTSDSLYAIQIPLKDIQSIKRYTPSIGIPHIIIVSESGIAFPPFYFKEGGVREFFYALKEHVNLTRSDEDANLYYLSDLTIDSQSQALFRSSIDKDKDKSPTQTAAISSSPSPNDKHSDVTNNNTNSNSSNSNLNVSGTSNSHKQSNSSQIWQTSFKPPSAIENLSWSILSNFSKVTQLARSATNPKALKESEYGKILHNLVGQSSSVSGADTQTRNPTLTEADTQHKSMVASLSIAPTSTKQEHCVQHPTTLGSFEFLEDDFNIPTNPIIQRQPPLAPDEWIGYFDSEGRISDFQAVKKRIFYGGIEPSIRIEVWKYLLNFYPWSSTYSEREQLVKVRNEEYNEWKSMWNKITHTKSAKWSKLHQRIHNIDKDVVRTDRTHPFYAGDENPNLAALNNILISYTFLNYDLGYVQGMNELLSPILYVMNDESIAFWCFHGIMDQMESNFHKDQNGMHIQLVQLSELIRVVDSGLYEFLEQKDCLNLFFCFRWIIIIFKREFDFSTIMQLWEVLWTHYLTPNFHLFIALAILLKYRKNIIQDDMALDDIIKFVNDLSGQLNLQELLVQAESLFRTFLRICEMNTPNVNASINDLKQQLQKNVNENAHPQKESLID